MRWISSQETRASIFSALGIPTRPKRFKRLNKSSNGSWSSLNWAFRANVLTLFLTQCSHETTVFINCSSTSSAIFQPRVTQPTFLIPKNGWPMVTKPLWPGFSGSRSLSSSRRLVPRTGQTSRPWSGSSATGPDGDQLIQVLEIFCRENRSMFADPFWVWSVVVLKILGTHIEESDTVCSSLDNGLDSPKPGSVIPSYSSGFNAMQSFHYTQGSDEKDKSLQLWKMDVKTRIASKSCPLLTDRACSSLRLRGFGKHFRSCPWSVVFWPKSETCHTIITQFLPKRRSWKSVPRKRFMFDIIEKGISHAISWETHSVPDP